MPACGGPELCWRTRQEPPSKFVYFILLADPSLGENALVGLQAGADDCLARPFRTEELHARVCSGVRIAQLEERLLTIERLQALTQTAGAVAHEISQPLSVLMGRALLLLRDASLSGDHRRHVEAIQRAGERTTRVVRKLQNARRFATRSYVGDLRIVDLDAAQATAENGDRDR